MPEQDPAATEPETIDAPTAAYSAPPVAPEPPSDPKKQTKGDLVERAAGLGINTDDQTKAELADAITGVQTTGRPPLSQIGVQALADEDDRTDRIYIDPDRPDHIQEAT